MFSSVVIGVKELPAARDALQLARILTSAKGNLALVYVQVVAPKPAPDSGAATAAVRQRRELERLAKLRDESCVGAEPVYLEARDVRDGLYRTVRARDADLLVIGASRYDVIYRDLVGDDTRALLENAPCPVAVAPVGYSAQQGGWRAIGVAYDGSPRSAHALEVARKLAADSGAKLSAFQAASGLRTHDPVLFNEAFEDEMTQARIRVQERTGVKAEVAYGEAAEELGRYGLSVDLLVLGAHSHRPNHVLGAGTVRRLADEPPCPLLVVP